MQSEQHFAFSTVKRALLKTWGALAPLPPRPQPGSYALVGHITNLPTNIDKGSAFPNLMGRLSRLHTFLYLIIKKISLKRHIYLTKVIQVCMGIALNVKVPSQCAGFLSKILSVWSINELIYNSKF